MNSISKKMLGEVVVFINGDRGVNYPKTKDYVPKGIPFFSASDLEGRTVNLSNAKFISNEAYEKLRNGKINEGDILFCLRGSLGNIGLAKNIKKGAIASSLVIIRPTKEIEKDFLYYILSGPINRKIVRELDNGSVQGNLSVNDLKKVEISLPNLDNQKAIAHILRTLDEKIILNKKINENLEEIAKALFKSWFIDFDPVKAKSEGISTGLPYEISNLLPNSFEDSEIGKIPNNWDTKKISEWGQTICGKTPSTKNPNYYGNDFMFITIPDLHKGLQITSSSKGLSKSGAELQSKKLLSKGSVLVSCIATPGLIGVIQESCFTNQQINSIIPKNKNFTWFIAFYLLLNKDILLSFGGGGSVFFNLNKSKFDSIEILSPPEKIIDEFNNFVSPLMDKCFALKKEISLLSNIRDTLLPKLISGEVNIPDAEKMIEEVGI